MNTTGKWKVASAMLAIALSGVAEAATILGEEYPYTVQGAFEIADDPATEGIDVQCELTWYNISDNVPANNQISASGNFGYADSGLTGYTTRDSTHFFNNPTIIITANDNELVYAPGVVNTPNQQDEFTAHFNLGTTNLALALDVVAEANGRMAGTVADHEAFYTRKSSIGGQVVGGAIPKDFENNPTVYTPFIANIPDAHGVAFGWYAQYGHTNLNLAGMLDDDGDGFLNWQEYHADTDPTNGQSLLVLAIAPGHLSYPSSTNCTYAVDWCGSLSSNVWNRFTNDVPGTGAAVSLGITNGTAQRFYRLQAARALPVQE
ncbi:hypothetical protein P4B35_14195 [Pontiellaceae bacterium B12227]|nr:hypothetical protein [Pontiellaceae bacterium B12227]